MRTTILLIAGTIHTGKTVYAQGGRGTDGVVRHPMYAVTILLTRDKQKIKYRILPVLLAGSYEMDYEQ